MTAVADIRYVASIIQNDAKRSDAIFNLRSLQLNISDSLSFRFMPLVPLNFDSVALEISQHHIKGLK
jgi:hypothetical protein